MARRTRDVGLQLGFDMAPILPKAVVPERAVLPSVASDAHGAASDSPPRRSKRASPASTPQEEIEKEVADDEPAVLSVGELTKRITSLLEVGIGIVWVEGEVSNLRRQSSGHSYFTLKDEESQLSCVLFARSASAQKLALRDGLQVRLHGQITVYRQRGQYQLMVRLVQDRGEGALQARFEELKCRLAAEGLFDPDRKRPLPRFPRRIGVVTSPTGAAIHDFLHVLHRRNPGLRVVISPVRVQGKGAAAEIAAAITEFSSGSRAIGPVDVIVVTRGGGSLEDLWEFNEEVVARAIAASGVPVVSAVGHEIDFSIADFVSDLRAPTPSAAAELLAADGSQLLERCRSLVGRIVREAIALLERHGDRQYRLSTSALFREPLRRLDEARQGSDRLEEILSGSMDLRVERLRGAFSTLSAQLLSAHPGHQLTHVSQRITSLANQLGAQAIRRLERDRGRLERTQAALSALDPKATLARGFSITRDIKGRVVTSASQVNSGELILTQLAEGELESEVREI